MIRLDDLEGHWRLSRVIRDARAGITGRFEGACVWRPDARGLVQEETGLLHYGAAPPMQAARRYLWRAEGAELQVFFDDGRPFHIVPRGGAEALHDCPPDIYRVRYDFDDAAEFRTSWHVTGPRKDAVIDSHFIKA